jgi:PIN domain nuclease of toxin-antitoxin system
VSSRILLDTHVAVWVAGSPGRLGPRTKKLIQSANEVSVSSISIAELNMKSMLGGIKMPSDLSERFQNANIPVTDFNSHVSETAEQEKEKLNDRKY